MKISDVIKALERIKEVKGDIEVKTQTMSHRWDPDIEVIELKGEEPWVLLNS